MAPSYTIQTAIAKQLHQRSKLMEGIKMMREAKITVTTCRRVKTKFHGGKVVVWLWWWRAFFSKKCVDFGYIYW